MMTYSIDLDVFRQTFSVKDDGMGVLSFSNGHKSGVKFRLFPFDTHPGSADVIKDLTHVVGGFMRRAQNEKTTVVSFEKLVDYIETVGNTRFQTEQDRTCFKSAIRALYFNDRGEFVPSNLGMFRFISCNAKEEKIAAYLRDGLCQADVIEAALSTAIKSGQYNVLEKLVMDFLSAVSEKDLSEEHYSPIVKFIQPCFCEDFLYLLEHETFAKEYLVDFLEHYYFFYTSQICFALNRFFSADNTQIRPLYYSVDWEKTGKSRQCYTDGWLILQRYLPSMFSHAVTLEILNQGPTSEPVDYVQLNKFIHENPEQDQAVAEQIDAITNLYRSCIHDCNDALSSVSRPGNCESRTEEAVRYLFDIVTIQFESTARDRASKAYTEKFELFCKTQILKNRKSMGLMLNLTERDILLLTKLCLKDRDLMHLNDVFSGFERRGVFLDMQSKNAVMQFYDKLNAIEKKSDSGDAQYVKGIL